jgi:hypothetical protein
MFLRNVGSYKSHTASHPKDVILLLCSIVLEMLNAVTKLRDYFHYLFMLKVRRD